MAEQDIKKQEEKLKALNELKDRFKDIGDAGKDLIKGEIRQVLYDIYEDYPEEKELAKNLSDILWKSDLPNKIKELEYMKEVESAIRNKRLDNLQLQDFLRKIKEITEYFRSIGDTALAEKIEKTPHLLKIKNLIGLVKYLKEKADALRQRDDNTVMQFSVSEKTLKIRSGKYDFEGIDNFPKFTEKNYQNLEIGAAIKKAIEEIKNKAPENIAKILEIYVERIKSGIYISEEEHRALIEIAESILDRYKKINKERIKAFNEAEKLVEKRIEKISSETKEIVEKANTAVTLTVGALEKYREAMTVASQGTKNVEDVKQFINKWLRFIDTYPDRVSQLIPRFVEDMEKIVFQSSKAREDLEGNMLDDLEKAENAIIVAHKYEDEIKKKAAKQGIEMPKAA